MRPYQERAMNNIFIEGKARSGLIVLPCGAGKTLVGILVTAKIKRNTIIICDIDLAVQQWKKEILRWCEIDKRRVITVRGKEKDPWD